MIMYFYHCWLQHYQDKYSYCKWDRYLFSTKPIFSGIKARFIGLQNSLNMPDIDILSRINFKEIFVNNMPLSDFDLNHLPKKWQNDD